MNAPGRPPLNEKLPIPKPVTGAEKFTVNCIVLFGAEYALPAVIGTPDEMRSGLRSERLLAPVSIETPHHLLDFRFFGRLHGIVARLREIAQFPVQGGVGFPRMET